MALLAAGPWAPGPGRAQAPAWPDRPVRLVVPWPPGGVNDILGRLLAERLAVEFGQPVLVENRGGSNGVLGAEAVARARPDGLTLMFHSVTSHATNPVLYARLPYDTLGDFAPVTTIAGVPMVIVVHPGARITTLAELVSRARAAPGALSYASFGNGSPSHLAGELLKQRLGIDLLHVPYRGGGPALVDTIAGRVQAYVAGVSTAVAAIEQGQVLALAVTSASRVAALPQVPTVEAAAGLPGYDLSITYGLWAPRGTPPAIIARLHDAARAALPALAERFATQGAVPSDAPTPEATAALVQRETERWGEIARRANATID